MNDKIGIAGLITTQWSATGFVLLNPPANPVQEILPSTQWSSGGLTTTEWIA